MRGPGSQVPPHANLLPYVAHSAVTHDRLVNRIGTLLLFWSLFQRKTYHKLRHHSYNPSLPFSHFFLGIFRQFKMKFATLFALLATPLYVLAQVPRSFLKVSYVNNRTNNV